jgi:hypothetical protein
LGTSIWHKEPHHVAPDTEVLLLQEQRKTDVNKEEELKQGSH